MKHTRNKWLPEDLEVLEELWWAGYPHAVIAEKMKRPMKTITSKVQCTPHLTKRTKLHPTHPNYGHGWTTEQAVSVRELWDEGLSATQVGLRIGKHKNSVIGYLTRHGGTGRKKLHQTHPEYGVRKVVLRDGEEDEIYMAPVTLATLTWMNGTDGRNWQPEGIAA